MSSLQTAVCMLSGMLYKDLAPTVGDNDERTYDSELRLADKTHHRVRCTADMYPRLQTVS